MNYVLMRLRPTTPRALSSPQPHQPLTLRVQPQRRRSADGADPVAAVRDRAHVRAGGGEPEAAEVLLERPVDLAGLQLLALRLLHVQLGLLWHLRFSIFLRSIIL